MLCGQTNFKLLIIKMHIADVPLDITDLMVSVRNVQDLTYFIYFSNYDPLVAFHIE